MLQAIRDKAGSLIVKILFVMLIASFGVWGIGDIFRNRGGETAVAEVGGHTIRADELQLAVRDELTRLRSTLGGAVDMEQAKQLGLIDTTLNRLVSRELVALETDRLNLAIGDETIRQAIQANPSFAGLLGTFDRTVYNRVLANNRLSEVQYDQRLRRDVVHDQLIEAVTAGGAAPAPLVDQLFRLRNEKRVADLVFLPLDQAGDVGEPSETDIAEYYEKNNERFRAPEYRGFTTLVLTADAVAKDITIPEDKLRDEYQARQGELGTPERREIEQIIVPGEEKAREAEKALAEGKDFLAVAKEVAGQEPDAVKLGWVTRGEMPTEIADAAFAAEAGKPTAAVQSPFGWHIIRVTAIEPARVQTFEEVAPKLKEALVHDLAADQLFKLSNDVEDALAGGLSLEDVATKFNLPRTAFEAVDPNGKTPAGESVTLPTGGEQILAAAFQTAQGQASRMAETREGAYYVLRVDKVVPSAIRPLAEVRDTILQMWKTEKQTAAVAAKAATLVETIKGGKPLADIAQEQGLKQVTTQPFLRTGAGADGLPSPLVSQLFGVAVGAAVTAPGTGGSYVAQLKSINVPDPAADAATLAQLSRQIETSVRDDLGNEYDRSLRQRYSVTVKDNEIARLF